MADTPNSNNKLELYELLLNHTKNMEVYRDTAGKIKYISPNFEKYLGNRKDDYLNDNLNLEEFVHPDDTELVRENYKKALQNIKTEPTICKIAIKDQPDRYISIDYQLVHNKQNKFIGIKTSLNDVTFKVTSEQKLLNYSKELEKANETRDLLFSIISHDLRSPLGIISDLAKLVKTKIAENDLEKANFFLDQIIGSGQSAKTILDNLLLWTKVQSKNLSLNPEKIDLHEIADEEINNLLNSANRKNIVISSEIKRKSYAAADKYALAIVIRNLISNAIKFTQNGGTIKLVCEILEYPDSKHNKYLFSISDTGIGIDPESQKKLFKLNSTSSKKGTAGENGTGLGLKICKDFIEQSGGKLTVESSPNIGSKFSFTIPAYSELT